MRIETAKGSVQGSFKKCIEWQREIQGSWPDITIEDGDIESIKVVEDEGHKGAVVVTLSNGEEVWLMAGVQDYLKETHDKAQVASDCWKYGESVDMWAPDSVIEADLCDELFSALEDAAIEAWNER